MVLNHSLGYLVTAGELQPSIGGGVVANEMAGQVRDAFPNKECIIVARPDAHWRDL